VLLDAGFAPQIVWTIPDGTFNNTQTVTADVGGIYMVMLTNEFGCSVTDSVEVIDDCTPQIYAPNAFVPSGSNNEFFVYTQYVADDGFEVLIYNRWGELIYQSNSRDFRWDGTSRGEPVPPGTYPFVVRFKGSTTDNLDQVYEERGGVTVIR
jgi:gliding motility-associated-like protein